MRVVYFTTVSAKIKSLEEASYVWRPTKAAGLDDLVRDNPEHEFIMVSEAGNSSLYDRDPADPGLQSAGVRYVTFPPASTVEEIAGVIQALAPDVAIAVPSAETMIDWEPLRCAEIADILRKKGLKAVCHPIYSAIAFMDKWRSHYALRELGFGVAKGIYVQNDMMFLEKVNPEITINAYKEYVFYRIKEMNFPVIVKSTTGAGSLGVQIVPDYQAVRQLLDSEQNTTDVMVEEFVQGESFGTEVHGMPGHYNVLPPLKFTTNAEGITDVFQSVKIGPVQAGRYGIPQLQEQLRRLAEAFKLEGSAQIDLVYKDEKWYIIEINPRYSGMTNTTTYGMEQRSFFQMYLDSALEQGPDYNDIKNLRYTVNFKIEPPDSETIAKISALDMVKSLSMTTIHKGDLVLGLYEVVLGGFDSPAAVVAGVAEFVRQLPEVSSQELADQIAQIAGEI